MNKTQAHIVKRRNRRNANGSFGLGTTTPAYAWDFVNNKARFNNINYGVLSNTPNWTFTRASTGYYTTTGGVLVPFASGSLRTGDRGALIEGAGTNLCLQSQTFDNASWTKTNVTVTADAAVAPDGTTTADKVEVTSTSSTTLYQQNITVSATAATASVYVKNGNLGASDCDDFLIRNVTTSTNIAGGKFNWTTGVFTASSGGTATVTSLTNGWYRITISIASGITSGDSLRFWVGNAGNTETAGNYFYAWGAQLEATAYASSYIPTTTASATRAADSLTVTGVTGLASTLTAFAKIELSGADSSISPNVRVAFSVTDGTTNERMYLYNISGNIGGLTQNGGVTQAAPYVVGTVPVGTSIKIAYRQDANNFQFCKNGTPGTPDMTGTLPGTPNQICIGGGAGGAAPLYGYVSQAAIFSRALSDAELQAVTI